MLNDFKDAAEFNGRVAVRMAKLSVEYHKGDELCPYYDTDLDSYIPLCHCTEFCKSHPKLGCTEVKLAWARMQVEEEMSER